jgi:hypothetical protein
MESFAPSVMVHPKEAAPLPPAAESQLLSGAPLPVAPDREITIVFAERRPVVRRVNRQYVGDIGSGAATDCLR